MTQWYNVSTLQQTQQSDNIKTELTQKNGITLIHVPCWWDGEKESLIGTIQFLRPDLHFKEDTEPISLNPHIGYFENLEVPHVGELMLASFPPYKYDFFDERKWWIGEKYDGVRFCWNPIQKRAYSRMGRQVGLTRSFARHVPPIFVDGEFWFGRGHFSEVYALVQGSDGLIQWQELRMIAFDIASFDMQNKEFEVRYSSLLVRTTDRPTNMIIVAPRILCKTPKQLHWLAQEIANDGGEGVIMRKVGSLYERGRNDSLKKLKAFGSDSEAIVVAIDSEYVQLRLPNGVNFPVPFEQVQIPTPSPGDVVSFSYDMHTRRDLPVNPVIYKLRNDLSWEDVVRNHVQEEKHILERKSEHFRTKPHGHWNIRNMQSLMEQIAKEKNMDPLLAETWYSLSPSEIRQSKGGRAVMQKFKGYSAALRALFPDTQFDDSNFQQVPWQKVETRRQFFENYAKDNDFDPLVPENWYSQPRDIIMTIKGAYSIVSYHGTLPDALIDLFPNIGLEKSRFLNLYAWHKQENRKRFFETYAKAHNFDPKIPDNWYSRSREDILSVSGAGGVLSYHSGSYIKALVDLFPNIGWDKSKFKDSAASMDVRRRYFENYAKINKFDPLNPSAWHNHPRQKILAHKGINRILSYHNGSLHQALLDLFPEIGLNKSRFQDKHSWHRAASRRKFFENYAKSQAFDPLVPQNWYKHPIDKILAVKTVHRVLSHHRRSVAQALLDLFPEIGFDKFQFRGSWHKKEVKKNFFLGYAATRGFDPLKPENWYSQPKEHIRPLMTAYKYNFFFRGTLASALVNIFPNLRWNISKFVHETQPEMHKPENRRKLFENYAKANDFDPLLPSNWYAQKWQKLIAIKGATAAASYHNGSLSKALAELFPNIGLDSSKFWPKSSNKKQKFFEKYAEDNGFDHLKAENWYSQPVKRIMAYKGAAQVISNHNFSVSQALVDLFPNIGLDKTKFETT
eukprot:Phypoly_transcript_01623.p1 GENE.Phypoly_transcript_01623~~Phypoly_transcript_01623.p1  ORF type:complete len:1048 (-),score=160.89 Phypoly_transcript_01623:116-2998(-)